MPIAILAPEGLPVPPTRGGSVQIYVHALQRSFDDIGVRDVCLLAPERVVRGNKLPSEKVSYRKTVLQILRDTQPHVVQVENRPDFVAAVRSVLPHAKLILNLHSTTFLAGRGLRTAAAADGRADHSDAHVAARSRMRRILSSVDCVVVNSHYLQQTISRSFDLGRTRWRSRVIYPGVDARTFCPREDGGIESGAKTFRILFVGRVIRQKGLDVVLRGLHLLQEKNVPFKITVVGRTPPWERTYRAHLETLGEHLPLEWVGFVSPSKLPDVYRSADVLVCPSQREEAFGLVNLEAMASGLPVVASKVGGIPEVVNTDTGVLVAEPDNPTAFARALLCLYQDSACRLRLAQQARERAQLFSWQRTAECFSEVYEELARWKR
ncbi:glycosyltransferase family 4 protein [Alicyclobacillus sp. SP_1]|jgi:spore coat protein SA|uniref:glycosyltransferase family 4 protein n=1 Tax=Alicyclobacillus sp. SP_1 TaxID=2942475 RepID=UPI0021573C45|nr:glycosyltransferase family 4 protein [Alicyclobacillus sp. SP_1]